MIFDASSGNLAHDHTIALGFRDLWYWFPLSEWCFGTFATLILTRLAGIAWRREGS